MTGLLSKSWSSLAVLLFLAFPAPAQSPSPSDSDCMTCHEDQSLKGSTGKSLHVDLQIFKKSSHGQMKISCVSCHTDLKGVTDFPHQEKLAPATCGDCHEKIVSIFSRSIHSWKHAKLQGRALKCTDCHDAHGTISAKETRSPISPFNVQSVCLKCHRNAAPETKGRVTGFVASYEESAHARALKKSGLNMAATCVTCHGSHNVKLVSDPESPVARKKIPNTCGTCHGGILSEYSQSIHGASFFGGNPKSPVCTDCHGEHQVQSPTVSSSTVYARNVPETCGRCHQDEKLVRQFNLATKRLTSFQSSFHGIALRLGELRVANCASCHGYHDILPASDPRSRVNPSNIPKTCGACHANAGTNWAQGKVHLAEPVTDNYWVYFTQKLYVAGISGSLGLFLLYIFADLWRWRRHRKSGAQREGDDIDGR